MTGSEEITAAAGILLSLGFSYIPGLSGRFGELSAERKRLVMLGLLTLVSLAVFCLGCAGIGPELGLRVTCDRGGAFGLLRAWFIAVVANQAAFLVSPKTRCVRRAIALSRLHYS